MSDIHVLEGNDDGTVFKCAFHYPIADVNNNVGQSIRTLIGLFEDTVSEVPGLAALEQTDLDNGVIIERIFLVASNAAHGNRTQELKDEYTLRLTEVSDEVTNKFKFTLFTTDVP
jgi:hypothetical protein